MDTATRQQAAQATAEVDQVAAVTLPEPGTQIVTLEQADAPLAQSIRTRMDELDMTNTQSIISF